MSIKIFEYPKDLTHNEKFLLDKIHEYHHKFLNLSIVDFSKEFYATKSTLSRLVKKLHFDSVLEMKLHLQQELTKKGLYQLEIDSTLLSRLNNLKIYNNYAITNTIENLDLNLFDIVCKKIANAKKILIFGIRSSFLAVQELAINLQKIGINAFYCNEIHESILKISNFNKNDLIIIFSKNAKNKEIMFLLKEAKNLEFETVLITANEEIKDVFTYKILLKNMIKDKRIIATCSKTSQLVIADAILHEVYFMNKNNDAYLDKSMKLVSNWTNYKLD